MLLGSLLFIQDWRLTMERKVYDRIFQIPRVQEKTKTRFDYNPNKPLPTTRHYNQGFSGSFGSEFEHSRSVQGARQTKRGAKYDEWKKKGLEKGSFITKKQERQGEKDHIGAVASSWLTSLGYNMASSEAIATFKDSNQEFFYKMPYDMFLSWYNSPSKGRWLHDHPGIMHNYNTRSHIGSMEDRLRDLDNIDKPGDRKMVDNSKTAKKKVDAYLSKWR
jgi:hypothetical protein